MLRVNVGCGASPTAGWVNLDNSPAVRIGRSRALSPLLLVLPAHHAAFARTARRMGIRWADARGRLPFRDRSVDVVYSSHMIDQLPRPAAAHFLGEARRVLVPGGVLRLATADLRRLAASYLHRGDADAFVRETRLALDEPGTLVGRVGQVLLGARATHRWMYDAASLARLVSEAGFVDVATVAPGETRIASPGPLDLHEREGDSVYLEASSP